MNQLTTETFVRQDDESFRLEEGDGIEKRPVFGRHQVGSDDGTAPVDAEVAVNQSPSTRFLNLVEECNCVLEMTLDVVGLIVLEYTDRQRCIAKWR